MTGATARASAEHPRRRWLPLAVALAAIVPATFLAALLLLNACLGETDGTGGPSPRQAVCYAWDGGAPVASTGVAAGAALVALVVALRRDAGRPLVWSLAALPAVLLVLVPFGIGLLPLD